MVNLPLALIGGVVGVYSGRRRLSVASMIGFITLFGIATRNGIMLVSHIQHLMREEGVPTSRRRYARRDRAPRADLDDRNGRRTRVEPIALAAAKPGSEIQTPMAIVIMCGLLTSTVLNMVVVPT